MKEIAVKNLPVDAVNQYLNQIPFFTDLALHNFQQYELLLQHSSLIELNANERIIEKGAIDDKFYFLLKGKLDVYPDSACKEAPISQLSSGQVFGALAIINQQPRTASLAASSQGATLFATNFTVFGQSDDFSQVKIETKLNLLRIVIHNARWKLEIYKMNEPEHALAQKIEQIDAFQGEKNSLEELHFLATQAKVLGDILAQWNNSQIIDNPQYSKENKKGGFFSFLRSNAK